jgi:sulfur carrier protein ThiS
MHVNVVFRPRRQDARRVELAPGATVRDVLLATGQAPDHTLVIRGSTPITESELLQDGEELTLLSAFSGG